MREQGIAANATPRMIRGRNKGRTRDGIYRAQQRGASNVVRERVTDIAKQLMLTDTFHDPARTKVLETRKSVVNGWLGIADALNVQGEVVLAGDVRHLARHLPRVITDRELVAKKLLSHLERLHKEPVSEVTRMRREIHTVARTSIRYAHTRATNTVLKHGDAGNLRMRRRDNGALLD